MDLGLLVLRMVVGLTVAGHGAQKLFGWFNGPGRAGTTQFMNMLGWRPASLVALVGGLVEFAGGLLLTLGLLTPVAGALVFAMLANAILSVHRGKGFWNTEGGAEFPLVLGVAALVLGMTGPGGWGVDTRLGWFRDEDLRSALALGLGFGAATVGYFARLMAQGRAARATQRSGDTGHAATT